MNPKIIYIAGYERSGSTLLHNILAEDKNHQGVGELRHFKKRLFDLKPCGCGENIYDCEFWSEKAGNFQNRKVIGFTRDKWIIFYPFLKIYLRLFRQKEIKFYRDLYRYAFDRSKNRTLIDSSKSLVHLFLLSRVLKYEVHTIFIVRNPSGILNSIKKRIEKNHQKYKIKNLRFLSFKIDLINWLCHFFVPRISSMTVVKYEDLINNRPKVISDIQEDTNAELSLSNNEKKDNYFFFSGTHSVDGGPTRHIKGEVKLKLDDDWKSNHNTTLKHSFTLNKFYRQ